MSLFIKLLLTHGMSHSWVAVAIGIAKDELLNKKVRKFNSGPFIQFVYTLSSG